MQSAEAGVTPAPSSRSGRLAAGSGGASVAAAVRSNRAHHHRQQALPGPPTYAGAVLRAGADAVAVGTALLLCDEAATSATHRAALADPGRPGTVITHAFTGQPPAGGCGTRRS